MRLVVSPDDPTPILMQTLAPCPVNPEQLICMLVVMSIAAPEVRLTLPKPRLGTLTEQVPAAEASINPNTKAETAPMRHNIFGLPYVQMFCLRDSKEFTELDLYCSVRMTCLSAVSKQGEQWLDSLAEQLDEDHLEPHTWLGIPICNRRV